METLVKYMVDVAMGMHYIAERGLVHRVCIYYINYIIVLCIIGFSST